MCSVLVGVIGGLVSKRVIGGDRYDVYGVPVEYSKYRVDSMTHQYTLRQAVKRSTSHTFNSCQEACEDIYPFEIAVVQHKWMVQGAWKIRMRAVLPCCYVERLCANCRTDVWTHVWVFGRGYKCTYHAGWRPDPRLSPMDIYCPGWRERYQRDDE